MAGLIAERTLFGLAELAGYRNDPDVEQAIHALYINPDEEDAATIGRLARDFETEARLAGRLPHPFLPSPPTEILRAGDLPIGRLPHYHEPVLVPVAGHKYVAGMTGSGKTTLVELLIVLAYRRGLRVVVFDPEGQFAPDIGLQVTPDELYVVDAQSYMVNPFDPPPGVSQQDWFGEMANVDREAWYFRRGAENFSTSIKMALHRSGKPLTLGSFHEAVRAAEPKTRDRREHDYYESVRTVVETLTAYLPALRVSKSKGIAEMLSRPVVVFDWSTLRNHQYRKYLTMHTLSWLLSSRQYEPDRFTDTLVVCDEVSKLASVELQNMSDIAEPFFVNALRTSRKRGIAFVTLDQNPARTHPVVRANSDAQVVMELTEGRDKDVIASDFDLTREQRAYLTALRPREAVVKLPHVPTPFLIEVPEIRHDPSAPHEHRRDSGVQTPPRLQPGTRVA